MSSPGQFRRLDLDLAAAAGKALGTSVDPTVRTRMRQLPQRLRASGLAATYAFLLSKHRDANAVGRAYAQVVKAIIDHVNKRRSERITPEKFLEHLTELNSAVYHRLVAEIDALSIWLSRLADAHVVSETSENERTGSVTEGSTRD